jgi:photosystem II stability/assembly factor-like uncharacterized protein
MKIEDRLRDGLRQAASEAPVADDRLEDLWRNIERGREGKRNRVAVRVATAAFALGLSAGAIFWFAGAFKRSPSGPVRPPTNALPVSDVRVYGVPIQKIYGSVLNPTAVPSGAAITCTLGDTAGHVVGTSRDFVMFIPAKGSIRFGPLPGAAGAASATCSATSMTAVFPSPSVAPAPVFQPTSITFWNERQGLVVGPKEFQGSTGMIQATDDGGRTWRVMMRSAGPLNDIVAMGPNHAWVLSGACAMGTCERDLLFSSDGGKSWARRYTGALERLSFVSPTDGWAITHVFPAGAQTLETTSDGGITWRAIRSPCPHVLSTATDLSFVSAAHGWLLCTGQAGAGQQAVEILETTDGGSSWLTVASSRAPSQGASSSFSGLGSGYPNSIFFLPDGHGWIGLNFDAMILGTQDAGRSWHRLGARLSDYQAGPVWFVSDSIGFALAGSGDRLKLVKTRAGGRTWTTVDSWIGPR